jgi:hypothetical protein
VLAQLPTRRADPYRRSEAGLVMHVRRELVLVEGDSDPKTLLVDAAPQIQQVWNHRLLDPLKVETLVRCAEPAKPLELELVAQSDAVCVFAVPLAVRRTITALSPDHRAWQSWLATDELRLDRATIDETRELHAVFKRLALMSAVGQGDAYLRIWFRSLGV